MALLFCRTDITLFFIIYLNIKYGIRFEILQAPEYRCGPTNSQIPREC